MLLEFVDHINESMGNISFSTGISTVFNLETSSGVIASILIPFSGFTTDGMSWVGLSELSEFLHGFLIE